jgi:hypothetical protein
MNALRWVLPVLAAMMVLIGDCPESEARCRLFGRRARRGCPSSCAAAGGCQRVTSARRDGITVCPLYGPMYAVGSSYLYYAAEYNPTTMTCGNNPQPAYLSGGTNTGCNPGALNTGCFSPGGYGAPPNHLCQTGHDLDDPPAWLPEAGHIARLDGMYFVGGDWRPLRFYYVRFDVDGEDWDVPLAFEDPDADLDPKTAYRTHAWHGAKCWKIQVNRIGLTYFTLLAD